MSNISLNVANDFYPRPAGRYTSDGKHSGEAFRSLLLEPKLITLNENDILVVDFTGVTMAGSSFLEEAFGGLVRVSRFNKEKLLRQLNIISPREVIKERIIQYIKEAK